MIGFNQIWPQPKPEPRAKQKARERRQAAKVVKSVRQQCVERDGHRCRAWYLLHMTECVGRLEWAHLAEQKRFKTRGKSPEKRHTTAGSVMLCRRHHQDYDQGRLRIVGDDANGQLLFEIV